MKSAGILSTASYLPPHKVTVDDFVRQGIDREQIGKWGVLERRIAGSETATDMEAKASSLALERAGIAPEEIRLIIGSATLPEKINPPNVNLTQLKIGAKNAGVFEVNMSCAGCIPAMMTASSLITSGMYETILLVASCQTERIIDHSDQLISVIMGAGASAVVMGRVSEGQGLVNADLQSDGRFWDNVGVEFRGPKNPEQASSSEPRDYFYIDEDTAFSRYALTSVPATGKRLLSKEGITIDEVDWVAPHQNFESVCEAWFKSLGIPREKVLLTYHKYGNLGAANMWTNLDEGVRVGKVKDGDLVLFLGQGSGFSVGSVLLRWSSTRVFASAHMERKNEDTAAARTELVAN